AQRRGPGPGRPHGPDRRRAAGRVQRPDGRRPGGLPDQVPQDGPGPVRVLPGQRLPVLRRHGGAVRGGRRAVGERGRRPGVDPGRPARRELRHLPGPHRPAGLRRQRLRRGLPGALDLGPAPVRGQPGPAVLAEGAAGRDHRRAGGDLRPGVRGPGAPLRRRRGRHRVGAHPGQRRGRGAGRAAPGQAADPVRAAGVGDRGGVLPPPVRRPGRRAPAARRRAGRAAGGLPGLPGDHPRAAQGQPRHLRRAGRGGEGRLRHRQRGAAGVQRAHRGLQPGPGQRRGAHREAGQRRGREPGGPGAGDPGRLRARRAPHGAVPAGAAGARRPVPGLDHDPRPRLRGQRVLPLRAGPGVGRADRAGGHGRAGRPARPGHREDPLRRRRRVRRGAGRRQRGAGGGGRGRRRRRRAGRGPARVRPRVRRPHPGRPPAVRGRLPRRRLQRGRAGL
ncbi:MAG: hypothetical protein AVDCRST_MAG41-2447, partial [uncultured Corynebacteriales bacterium]